MKTFLTLLLSACACLAQMGLRSGPVVVTATKPAASAPAGISVPTDIAGCRLWLDASTATYSDAGVTKCGNDVAVAQWSDRSGYFIAQNFTSETAGKQPTNYTSVIGTNAAVWFNGGQYLTNRTYLTNLMGVIHTTNCAIFCLARGKPGVTASQRLFYWLVSQGLSVLAPFSDGKLYVDFPSATDRVVSGASLITIWTNSVNLFEFRRNGGLGEILTNGVSNASKTDSAVDQTDAGISFAWLGATSDAAGWISGYVFEFLIYSPCPSDSDRCKIRNYFRTRYGLSYDACSP